jgi:hypothetical protein
LAKKKVTLSGLKRPSKGSMCKRKIAVFFNIKNGRKQKAQKGPDAFESQVEHIG